MKEKIKKLNDKNLCLVYMLLNINSFPVNYMQGRNINGMLQIYLDEYRYFSNEEIREIYNLVFEQFSKRSESSDYFYKVIQS